MCTHDKRKEREIFEKTTEEKLENMNFFKLEGNKALNDNDLEKASYNYQMVLIY